MEEFKVSSKKTAPKSAGSSVAAAGRVAASPETRLKPTNTGSDKEPSAALARVQRMHNKGFSATLRKG